MAKIQIDYLYPKPDPITKLYEFRSNFFEIEFLKRLINIKGLPYYVGQEGSVLFLDGQYSFDKIQKILREHGD